MRRLRPKGFERSAGVPVLTDDPQIRFACAAFTQGPTCVRLVIYDYHVHHANTQRQ